MSNAAKFKKRAADFESQKQFDKAIASYVRAIEAGDAEGGEVDVALLNKVGDLTLRLGRVAEAVTSYERAVEHYSAVGLFNNAIALCNKILRHAPGRVGVYLTLGRVCARKGMRGDATRNFLEYAARMQKEGRTDDAMKSLAEVAGLMPELTEVRRLVEEHAARVGIALPAVADVAAQTAEHAAPGADALVFLDIDYDSSLTPPLGSAPIDPLPEVAPAIAAGRASTPPSNARTNSLDDLLIFDPSEDDGADIDYAEPLDGFEANAPELTLEAAEAQGVPAVPSLMTSSTDAGREAIPEVPEGLTDALGYAPQAPDELPVAEVLDGFVPESEDGLLLDVASLDASESEAEAAAAQDVVWIEVEEPEFTSNASDGEAVDLDSLAAPQVVDEGEQESIEQAVVLDFEAMEFGGEAQELNDMPLPDLVQLGTDGSTEIVSEGVRSAPLFAPDELAESATSAELVGEASPVELLPEAESWSARDEHSPVDADGEVGSDIAAPDSDSIQRSEPEAQPEPTDAAGAESEVAELGVAESKAVESDPDAEVTWLAEVEALATEFPDAEGTAGEDGGAALMPGDGDVAAELAVAELVADDLGTESIVIDEDDSIDVVASEPVGHHVNTDDVITDDVIADDLIADDLITDDVISDDLIADDVITDDLITDDLITEDGVTESLVMEDAIADDAGAETSLIAGIVLEDRLADDDRLDAVAALNPEPEQTQSAVEHGDGDVRVDDSAIAAELQIEAEEPYEDASEWADSPSLAMADILHESSTAVTEPSRYDWRESAPRLDPHDFILPGELPPIVLPDSLLGVAVAPSWGGEHDSSVVEPVEPVELEELSEMVGSLEPAEPEERDWTSEQTTAPTAGLELPLIDDGVLDLEADGFDVVPDSRVFDAADTLDLEAADTLDLDADDALDLDAADALDLDTDDTLDLDTADALGFDTADALRLDDDDTIELDENGNESPSAEWAEPLPESSPELDALLTPQTPAVAMNLALDRCARLREEADAHPGDWARRRRLAEALLEAGEVASGLDELAAITLGLEVEGEFEQAARVSDDIVRVAPDAIPHHLKRVELAVRLGDRDRLRASYLDMADALVRTGMGSRAESVYVRVLELDPWDDRARAALGDAAPPPPARPPEVAPADDGYVNLADWLSDDSGQPDTRMRLREPTVTGDEDADFDRLLQHFREGVSRSLGDDDYESHYDLGVAYKEMGLLDDAIAEFQRALRSPTHRLPAYEALGQCFLEQGSFPVAVTVLSRALHEPGLDDEQRVGVLYLLGYACEALQRRDEARSYFQRVYATDIHFRDVADRLAALDRGV